MSLEEIRKGYNEKLSQGTDSLTLLDGLQKDLQMYLDIASLQPDFSAGPQEFEKALPDILATFNQELHEYNDQFEWRNFDPTTLVKEIIDEARKNFPMFLSGQIDIYSLVNKARILEMLTQMQKDQWGS